MAERIPTAIVDDVRITYQVHDTPATVGTPLTERAQGAVKGVSFVA